MSFPHDDRSSINSQISETYGAISYNSVADVIVAIQQWGGESLLIKRDFENPFHRILVSPIDSPLLEFSWQDNYYEERFLPFGPRTAAYLFNFFAEAMHWILDSSFNSRKLRAEIVHYLDDFILIIPACSNMEQSGAIFSDLCEEIGLVIKESKNEQGFIASFGGVELDTRKTVVR